MIYEPNEMNNGDQTTLLAERLVNSGHVNASSLPCLHAARASARLTEAEPSARRPLSVIMKQAESDFSFELLETL